jgi:predicted protein tyrosine phosphatase
MRRPTTAGGGADPLVLHVHDIAEELDGHVAPCRQHLLDVLDFTADLAPGANLLVHCIAGVSRSTAAAIGILIACGMSWPAAWEQVAAVRPCMLPNARIIRLIDEHHRLGGQLVGRSWSVKRAASSRRDSSGSARARSMMRSRYLVGDAVPYRAGATRMMTAVLKNQQAGTEHA